MSFQLIKGDKRTTAFRDWKPWLEAAGSLYDRYTSELDFCPFDANEQTAVGLFVAGAGEVGYLSLIEYGMTKRTRADLRKRKPGRADLWMNCGSRSYSFEFKRSWYSATLRNLRKIHNIVKHDIAEIPHDECEAGVAVSISYIRDEKRLNTYRKFSDEEDIDYCFLFGPEAEGGAFIYMTLKA